MTTLEQYSIETPEQWRRDQVQHLSAAGASYRLEGRISEALGCERWVNDLIQQAESEEELDALEELEQETIEKVVNGEVKFYGEER